MSSKSCYIPECKEIPHFICDCTDKVFICPNHILNHLYSSGKHTITNMFVLVSDNIKDETLNYFSESFKILRKNKHYIKKYTEKIISSVTIASNLLIKTINKEESYLKNNLDSLLKNSLIDVDLLDNILKKSNNYCEIWKNEDDEILEDIKALFLKNLKNEIEDDDYLLSFRPSASNVIDLIDLQTLKKSSITFEINDISQLCACCKLDKYKYFVYGGYNPIVGLAKIIDIKSLTSEILPSSSQIMLSGACLVNQDIYVFGGCSDGSNTSNISKNFNLIRKTWNNISNLPESNYRTSATLIKSKIYVAGYQSSNIFEYCPYQNSFNILSNVARSNILKFFAKNWLVCFGDNLYELGAEINFISRCPFNLTDSNYNSTVFSERCDFIYFLTQDYKLIRIDTKRKIIEVVTYS